MIQIGNVALEHPVFLTAGCVKYPQEARQVLSSPSSAVVIGSLTKAPYGEEYGDIFWVDGARSVTRFGLPNPGIDAWCEELRILAEEAEKLAKPLIVNVAGADVQDYLELAERAFEFGASAVEFNLAWPNLSSTDGRQKYTFSDHPNSVADLLREARVRFKREKANLWLKFSPLQPTILDGMVRAIKEYGNPLVTAIVCCSPFPKTLVFDDEGKSVVGKDGFGRMGGDFLRPIALGQVKQFRKLLPNNIAVIGVGGVSTRAHVEEYLSIGASAVGLTTAYLIAGEEIFSHLLHQDPA